MSSHHGVSFNKSIERLLNKGYGPTIIDISITPLFLKSMPLFVQK